MKIPLSAPDINAADLAAVNSVMQSGRLSLGPVMEQFEADFAAYVGVPHGVAVSSGTAALHLALLALGIGPGDEVIVPSFAFIAAANGIRYVGATPVFVDVDAITLCLDPNCVAAAITQRTRALMIVHTFGVMAQMDRLLELALRHNLRTIEDACEAPGAELRGQRAGSLADAGVFGFYPNKQMTTGEGGMLVTRQPAIADAARALRNQGRETDDWFNHQRLGFNYRLSEINCALGVSQLRRLEAILAQRAHVAALYAESLLQAGLVSTAEHDGRPLTLPLAELSGGRISWFVYVVRLAAHLDRQDRDRIVADLQAQGIGCGRYFAPIHRQPAYAGFTVDQSALPVTDFVADRTIALPFFNHLSREDVETVTRCLAHALSTT